MVAAFSPPDVRQVRMTGPAALATGDHERVRRIYLRYVGTWTPGWEEQASSAGYGLWSMTPQREWPSPTPAWKAGQNSAGPACRNCSPSGTTQSGRTLSPANNHRGHVPDQGGGAALTECRERYPERRPQWRPGTAARNGGPGQEPVT